MMGSRSQRIGRRCPASARPSATDGRLALTPAAIVLGTPGNFRATAESPPKLAEARSILDMIVSNSRRASQIFDNIGSLFKGDNREQKPVDMNEIILGRYISCEKI